MKKTEATSQKLSAATRRVRRGMADPRKLPPNPAPPVPLVPLRPPPTDDTPVDFPVCFFPQTGAMSQKTSSHSIYGNRTRPRAVIRLMQL